jgi:AraC-like DNA-binding protein
MIYRIGLTADGILQYPMHTHKNYEIMLYLEGEGYMQTALGDIPFRPGTVVIVPPGIMHGSVSDVGFKNISLEGEFDGYFHFDGVKSFSDNELGEGKQLASMIYNNRYGSEEYLTSLCTAYVCFLMQRFEMDGGALDGQIRGIIFEISRNAFDSNIDLVSILCAGGYSEDYIRACFKKSTGKTPNEFLTDIRMKHACFLIDVYKKSLPLSEIAERCGYLDYTYFSKRFKEYVGVAPRLYRGE